MGLLAQIFARELRTSFGKAVAIGQESRLLVSGLPWEFSVRVLHAWGSSAPGGTTIPNCYAVTMRRSSAVSALPGVLAVHPAYLLAQRKGSHLIVVDPECVKEVPDSILGSGGTVQEVWSEGYPWKDCEVEGFGWAELLENWIGSLGVTSPAEVGACAARVAAAIDDLAQVPDRSARLLLLLDDFPIPKGASVCAELSFWLGIPAPGRPADDIASALEQAGDVWENLNEIGADYLEPELVSEIPNCSFASTAAAADVQEALGELKQAYFLLSSQDKSTPLSCWRRLTENHREAWERLSTDVLRELQARPGAKPRISISGVRVTSPVTATIYELASPEGRTGGRILLRDPGQAVSIELNLTPNKSVEDTVRAGTWNLYGHVKSGGSAGKSFAAVGGSTIWVEIPPQPIPRFAGRHVLSASAGPSPQDAGAKSRGVQVHELDLRSRPVLVAVDGSKFQPPDLDRRKRTGEQQILLPKEGTYRVLFFLSPGSSKVNLRGFSAPLRPSSIPAASAAGIVALETAVYLSDNEQATLEWEDPAGHAWNLEVKANLEESETREFRSFTDWLLHDLSRPGDTSLRGLIRGLAADPPVLLTSATLRVSPETSDLSVLESEVVQTPEGWWPVLVPLAEPVSPRELKVRNNLRIHNGLRLHAQANRWNSLVHGAASAPFTSPLVRYAAAREAVLSGLEKFLDPALRRDRGATAANLVRQAPLGLLDPDLIREYLEAFVGILNEFRTLPPTDPLYLHHLCVDTVLAFRHDGNQPDLLLLGPCHPLVLGRLHLLQQRLIHRLSSGRTTNLGRLLADQILPSWGTTLNGAFAPVPATAVRAGDPHWALLLTAGVAGSELKLPAPETIEWLASMGLDPAVGPLGLDPVALIETVENYLMSYPARRSLTVRLEDDNAPSETDSELRGLIHADDGEEATELGKLLPGGLVVLDARPVGTTRDFSQQDPPVKWLRARAALDDVPSDISTLSRPAAAELVGGTAAHAALAPQIPFVEMPIWQSDLAARSFRVYSGLAKAAISGKTVEDAFHDSLVAFEPAGVPGIEWNTSIGAQRAEWQVCSGSQVDPRMFVEYAAEHPRTALWSFRLFGRGIQPVSRPEGPREPSPTHGHFILARVSPVLISSVRSILKSFAPTSGLDPATVLKELGEAGLALGDEFIRTGRKAEGAMGLFLCQRILWNPPGDRAPLPRFTLGRDGQAVTSAGFMLQLDPFHGAFSRAVRDWNAGKGGRRASGDPESARSGGDFPAEDFTRTHADLLGFHLAFCKDPERGERLHVQVLAIESKFHTSPGPVPRAAEQARATASQTDHLLAASLDPDGLPERVLLAEVIRLGLRLSAGAYYQASPGHEAEWSSFERKVLESVLAGDFEVARTKPLVIIHKPGTTSLGLPADPVPVLELSLTDWANELMLGKEAQFAHLSAELALYARVSCPDSVLLPELVHAPPVATVPPQETVLSVTTPPPAPSPQVAPSHPTPPEPEAAGPGVSPEAVTRVAPPPPPDLQAAHAQADAAFQDFIGNKGAVDRLKIDLVHALIQRPPHLPSAFLLTGNPSVGKTTLAMLIARVLNVPFVVLDGPSAADRQRIVEAINHAMDANGLAPIRLAGEPQGVPEFEYPALVLLIDEVHLVPRRKQEGLLTLTEPGQRFVRLPDRICRFPRATYIAATTKSQQLDPALRTRFQPEIHLDDYTESEVAEMVGRRHPELPEDVRRSIARIGQNVPRIALRYASDLLKRKRVSLEPDRDWQWHFEELRKSERLDPNGLGRDHYALLEILNEAAYPVGIDQIEALAHQVDRPRVEEELLPTLQRMGLIELRGTAGRAITAAGREYLARQPRP